MSSTTTVASVHELLRRTRTTSAKGRFRSAVGHFCADIRLARKLLTQPPIKSRRAMRLFCSLHCRARAIRFSVSRKPATAR
jgi:hypothetical protein